MQTQTEFLQLRSHLEQVIVGQSALLDRLMIALLTGGHILLESLPGLAPRSPAESTPASSASNSHRI